MPASLIRAFACTSGWPIAAGAARNAEAIAYGNAAAEAANSRVVEKSTCLSVSMGETRSALTSSGEFIGQFPRRGRVELSTQARIARG